MRREDIWAVVGLPIPLKEWQAVDGKTRKKALRATGFKALIYVIVLLAMYGFYFNHIIALITSGNSYNLIVAGVLFVFFIISLPYLTLPVAVIWARLVALEGRLFLAQGMLETVNEMLNKFERWPKKTDKSKVDTKGGEA